MTNSIVSEESNATIISDGESRRLRAQGLAVRDKLRKALPEDLWAKHVNVEPQDLQRLLAGENLLLSEATSILTSLEKFGVRFEDFFGAGGAVTT
ncbi:MAG: hypothetical protein WBG50_10095 [Desulfomonilaceae bacterium]